jgi:hypothetical protein
MLWLSGVVKMTKQVGKSADLSETGSLRILSSLITSL